MPVIPGTKESFIGALLENIIYGVYFSVFSECCVLFYKKKKTQGTVHAYLLVTTGVMFTLITVRCILDNYRCIIAFNNDDLNPGPPNSVTGILGNACLVLVVIVADVFIVFRTFIVWSRNWLVIIIPSLLFLANLIIAVFAMISYVELGSANATIWSSVDWLNAFISLTLCTNTICTGLISFRIIQVYRRVAWMTSARSRSGHESLRIVSVIVESAATFTTMLVATLVVGRLKGFVIFILIDCLPPTTGLVFSYIIIRVSRGTSYGEMPLNHPPPILPPMFSQYYSGNNRGGESGSGQTISITLERTTHVEGRMIDDALTSEGQDGAKYAAIAV
ncbi:hypothetical protein MVEN_00691200 [Mycena venus]|uniref:Uncharacterized protein n=1 Tax=Mycena venus TaxID=2733690 RepID=A0A8H6YEI6_9AGAR|nr:hypothetical protein MVEN_00691200 [Mycena venus]